MIIIYEALIRINFVLAERPQHCSVHLVNGGSVLNGSNVTAEFSGNGPISFYTCFLNGRVFMERCK